VLSRAVASSFILFSEQTTNNFLYRKEGAHRLTRSVKDLCGLLELFEKRKVALISVAESRRRQDGW
jgi:hypothetical protein